MNSVKILFFCLSLFASAVHAQGLLKLTLDYPKCKNKNSSVLPEKYYTFPKKYPSPSYRWVNRVKRSDVFANGAGLEQADGSRIYSWISMYKFDVTNDGVCDWFVNSSVPHSSGGGRSSANIIYVGSKEALSALISDRLTP